MPATKPCMGRAFLAAFGGRVRHARLGNGLTLRALARRLGVSHVAVARVECGLNCFTADRLEPLARVLGVTVGWLVTGQEEH
jgi:transcriptional regulator with XRE-family HTH domain